MTITLNDEVIPFEPTESLDERAHAGAVWLDERIPNWWRAVDLQVLDQKWPGNCVVTQVCRSLATGPTEQTAGFYTVCCDGPDAPVDLSGRPGWSEFIAKLGLTERMSYEKTVLRGFTLTADEAASAQNEERMDRPAGFMTLWGTLTDAWRIEITERISDDVPSDDG